MKLSELILHVGDRNVMVQRLDTSLVSSKTNRKGVTQITFATDQIHTNDLMYGPPSKVGLVVWLPAERMPASMGGANK